MSTTALLWSEALGRFGDRPALIDEQGAIVSYRELDARVTTLAQALGPNRRALGFVFAENNVESIVALLASLRSGHVPLLLSSAMSADARQALMDRYQPDWTIDGEHDEPQWHRDHAAPETPLAPELGLLLSTSGTTASPKLVRIPWRAVQENARAIAMYLNIGEHDRALTVLPPSYSYGLSVITSHLLSGACVVVQTVSVLSRDFVRTIDEQQVTSISGVPYTYQMLHRTGFGRNALPSLRVLTQAGGRLPDNLVREFSSLAAERDWRFYVMYGQTEATARISYVPPERLAEKIGSIGIAIPGGSLDVDHTNGELIYRGPNVALGYATTREELARGDDFGGVLRTGDLVRCDDDGFHFITGRLSRFIKVAGNRVGLDDVEQRLQTVLGCPVSVGGRDDRLVALLESTDDDILPRARAAIADEFRIHHSLCRLHVVDSLPLLSSGKKDYASLMVDE